MALINPKKSEEKAKVKLELSQSTFAQINAYCKWASIDDLNHFFEEAASFIFTKDKSWKDHLKSTKIPS